MTDNRKTTVPGASVGADAVQSSHKTSTNIITNSDKQINLQAAKKYKQITGREHGIND